MSCGRLYAGGNLQHVGVDTFLAGTLHGVSGRIALAFFFKGAACISSKHSRMKPLDGSIDLFGPLAIM